MDRVRFKKKPFMGILRNIELNQIEPLIEAIIVSGLECIEIAMNTQGASALIQRAKEIAKERLMLGAGTILDTASLRLALNAGASFIVSPVLIKEVVAYCLKKKIPCFPGALTPQEIYHAWREGATMVKVFPAKVFGPQYFREIKGPFKDIELLACGGITPENLQEYFKNGASAVAFGASVFREDWLKAGDYQKIINAIKAYL